jgi:hypothetical protein
VLVPKPGPNYSENNDQICVLVYSFPENLFLLKISGLEIETLEFQGVSTRV